MYFIHSRRMFVEYARPLSLFISALTCSGSSGEVISAESNFPMQKSPKIKCTLFFLLSSCIDVPMMELYRQSKYSCTQDVFFLCVLKYFLHPRRLSIYLVASCLVTPKSTFWRSILIWVLQQKQVYNTLSILKTLLKITGLLKGIFIIWLRSNRPETSLD